MKVVHLSTSDGGGAGIAARRLHLALLGAGVGSSFVTRFSVEPNIPNHRALNGPGGSPGIGERLRRRVRYHFPWLFFDPHRALSGRKPGFDHFSFPFPGEDLARLPEVRDADLVHLHWVADGMLDYRSFFRAVKKPVIWTLHDMNPFTGGCHHADFSKGFLAECKNCPQLEGTGRMNMAHRNHNYKAAALERIKSDRMAIVAPSAWLADLSSHSTLLRRFGHRVIPNYIGQNTFMPADRNAARHSLGLSSAHFMILFSANDVDNRRKGIHHLVDALKGHPQADTIICTLGKGRIQPVEGPEIKNLGQVTDETILAKTYTAADLFVLPSLAENFPNTVAEALLCGTPVAASRTGGIPEQVDDASGRLFDPGNAAQIAATISYMRGNMHQFNRDNIRRHALERFGDRQSLNAYLSLYQELYDAR